MKQWRLKLIGHVDCKIHVSLFTPLSCANLINLITNLQINPTFSFFVSPVSDGFDFPLAGLLHSTNGS